MGTQTAELERLFLEVGPLVWSYLLRRLGDRSAAEDLLQETFLAVAEDFAAVEAAECRRAWIIGIARNLLRHHWRLAAGPTAAPLPPEVPTSAEPEVDPRVDAMRRAISRLPDGQREALELRLSDDLSYVEIAQVLAIPVGTVRSRIHNAIAALRTWAAETDIRKILEA